VGRAKSEKQMAQSKSEGHEDQAGDEEI